LSCFEPALACDCPAGVLGLAPQEYPLITLRGYIVFWGCAFTLLTLAIAMFKQETDHYTGNACVGGGGLAK
jgi:hypothetical protein